MINNDQDPYWVPSNGELVPCGCRDRLPRVHRWGIGGGRNEALATSGKTGLAATCWRGGKMERRRPLFENGLYVAKVQKTSKGTWITVARKRYQVLGWERVRKVWCEVRGIRSKKATNSAFDVFDRTDCPVDESGRGTKKFRHCHGINQGILCRRLINIIRVNQQPNSCAHH